jgi:deoxyribodipyrimidine photo-lyase
LAWGTLSARRAVAMLDAFERQHGRSKSSYWLWFELMWREHFRWLHQRFGRALYRARGLARQPRAVRASHADWQRWCTGQTGQALVDSGMRELAATGFLSNRMRQIVASHWLHDMGGDWRAGAAWFEAQLMDEDVYNNQGNWLYIAGLGTDPRGGRRFDTERQAAQHDPEGSYRQLWGRS